MFSYQWILVTLAVLPVLLHIRRYWKSSFPPSLPPIISLQGMPPELRNIVYEFIAINTSRQAMRVVSGKRLVAAYDKPHARQHAIRFTCTIPIQLCRFIIIGVLGPERRPVSYNERIAIYNILHKGQRVKLMRTNLKWYLGRVPMPNILVPVVDVASILPLATAGHPLSATSRQLRAEFQYFDRQASGGAYLFILNNFDLKQMGIIAASINALDTEARARDPPAILQFHVRFAMDHNAVASARKLCNWIEETSTVPLGLEYIAHKMTKIQVTNGLTEWQEGRIYWMFRDLRRRLESVDSGDSIEVAVRPIRFVNFLFKNKVKVHRPRGLGTWAPSEIVSWDAMARVTMG